MKTCGKKEQLFVFHKRCAKPRVKTEQFVENSAGQIRSFRGLLQGEKVQGAFRFSGNNLCQKRAASLRQPAQNAGCFLRRSPLRSVPVKFSCARF
ncbi:MAG: hypothetical protein RSD27_06560 [Ruthenibacterium sp.]